MSDRTWLESYLWAQRAWSAVTFGAGRRTLALTRAIEHELDRIVKHNVSTDAWLNVVIWALDGFWRSGGRPEELEWQLRALQDKNFQCEIHTEAP